MRVLADLVGAGKLKPVIARSYSLEQIAEAFRYVERGRKKECRRHCRALTCIGSRSRQRKATRELSALRRQAESLNALGNWNGRDCTDDFRTESTRAATHL
jgi:hypothetical protein